MNEKKTRKFPISGDKLVLLGAIIAVFILFTALNKNFLSFQNIVNILVAASLVGMVAIGHTYLIIAGQNDLSPGSLAAFSGTMAALLVSLGVPFFGAVLITIAFAVLIGLFNAFMVNKIHLEAFIATLVTQSIIRGAAYIICDGKPVAISNKAFLSLGKLRFLNVPLSVWIMLVCILIFGIILSKTKFGRSVYAIGGIIFAARMNSGQPAANVNLEFDAITAVILGGVSFVGGVGDMFGTFLGIILIQAFNTGLIMVEVPTFWHYVARGGLLLFALTSDYVRKQKREKDLLAASMKNL